MVVRLWVPLIQVLRPRNRKSAISGLAFTASRVANSVGTSTPLRGVRAVVVSVIGMLLVVGLSMTWQDVREPAFREPSPATRREGHAEHEAERPDSVKSPTWGAAHEFGKGGLRLLRAAGRDAEPRLLHR